MPVTVLPIQMWNGQRLSSKSLKPWHSVCFQPIVFLLYDTFGFPLDLTELILRENGMTVNIEEFNEEMQQQKQRARNAAAIETGDWIVLKEGTTEFVGYDYTEYEASILRYRQIKQKNQTLYQIVLDYTPFYASQLNALFAVFIR